MQIYLAATPDKLREAAQFTDRLAHVAYRVGPDGRLTRQNLLARTHGGLMVLGDRGCGPPSWEIVAASVAPLVRKSSTAQASLPIGRFPFQRPGAALPTALPDCHLVRTAILLLPSDDSLGVFHHSLTAS